MQLILINLLYDLWSVEEPYPYTNSSGKHKYSLAVIHSSMQKWYNWEVNITLFEKT